MHSDASRLRQVLVNLIGNALKFTRRGHIELHTSWDAPSELTFQLTDTGIGIAPDRVEGVFGEFSQADESISRRFGGTGLGLAISSQLAQLMGGGITCESTLGEGTTFTLRVPALEAVAEVPEATTTPPESCNRSLNVLVVEDNHVNWLVAERVLQSLGHEPTLAQDGDSGIEAAGSGRYDVILMDGHMPGTTGVEATRRIRALPRHSEVPIIAVTASALESYRQEFLEAGADEFVTKPFGIESLRAVLTRAATIHEHPPTPT